MSQDYLLLIEHTADVRCRCGHNLRIPLKADWHSPLYVMHMEKELKVYDEWVKKLQRDLVEMGKECVDAGFKPSFLRRVDDLKARFESLLDRMEKNKKDA